MYSMQSTFSRRTAQHRAMTHQRWLQAPEPECGILVERSLTMTRGCQGDKECHRSYFLSLPCSNHGPAAPLLFAIHCFGCTAETMMHWNKEAAEYGFALVIPQGLQKAFNAKVCCGYPLHNNVDDKAFFQEIIAEVSQEHPQISSSAVYGTGWSNGGYMVTYAAELFRAIAPISGYQYDSLDQLSPDHPVGLFLHQASDDPNVRATGCCTDSSMPHCCCGISELSPDTCLSAEMFAQQYGETVNGCAASSFEKVTIAGVECYSSSSSPSCQKYTTYCIHPAGQHFNRPSHEKAFPPEMRQQVMEFFKRDLCYLPGNEEDNEGVHQYCQGIASSQSDTKIEFSLPGDNDTSRPLSAPIENSASHSPPSSSESGLHEMVAPVILMLFVSILATIGYRSYRAHRDKYGGFEVLAPPTLELGSIRLGSIDRNPDSGKVT